MEAAMTTKIKMVPVSDTRQDRRQMSTPATPAAQGPRVWLVQRARARLAAGVYDSDRCLLAAVGGLLAEIERTKRRIGRPEKSTLRMTPPLAIRPGEDRVARPAKPSRRRGR